MKRFPRKRSLVWLCALTVVLSFQPAAVSAQAVTAVPFYRFYLAFPPEAQVHYYSTDKNAPAGMRFERIEGFVSPVSRSYTLPLRRFYYDPWVDHVYTTVDAEAESLRQGKASWKFVGSGMIPAPYSDEGVAGYVVPADRDIPGTVPLYRFTRKHRGDNRIYQDHFYSLDSTVPAEYIAEGICCRVWKDPVQLPDALLTISAPGANARWAKGSSQTVAWQTWGGGGFTRISYSTNAGQSWSTLASVPAAQNFGVMSNGSYVWQLPPTLAGMIRIKLDWVSSPGAALVPWASVQTGNIQVGPSVPPKIKRK